MLDYYRALGPVLRLLPPETAHRAAIRALACGWVPDAAPQQFPRLALQVCGVPFANPIGLAAGFDKNAEAVAPLLSQGFGFVEAGTVTPRAQSGNPRPRLFRLAEDAAVINRLGFNNEGVDAFCKNLERAAVARMHGGIVGCNIGKNKDSADAVADYLFCLERVYPYADYVTVNISSPNTAGLRDLQERSALDGLLEAVMARRDVLAAAQQKKVPLWVKIAPDMSEAQCEDVAEIALARAVDGLIVTNTTLARPDSLRSAHRAEAGGLSGAPLFVLSTSMLARFYRLTGGALPLIGAGGVQSGADAYAKIRAGASLVQLYSALVYRGMGLVPRILKELDALLARDGHASVADARGQGNGEW